MEPRAEKTGRIAGQQEAMTTRSWWGGRFFSSWFFFVQCRHIAQQKVVVRAVVLDESQPPTTHASWHRGGSLGPDLPHNCPQVVPTMRTDEGGRGSRGLERRKRVKHTWSGDNGEEISMKKKAMGKLDWYETETGWGRVGELWGRGGGIGEKLGWSRVEGDELIEIKKIVTFVLPLLSLPPRSFIRLTSTFPGFPHQLISLPSTSISLCHFLASFSTYVDYSPSPPSPTAHYTTSIRDYSGWYVYHNSDRSDPSFSPLIALKLHIARHLYPSPRSISPLITSFPPHFHIWQFSISIHQPIHFNPAIQLTSSLSATTATHIIIHTSSTPHNYHTFIQDLLQANALAKLYQWNSPQDSRRFIRWATSKDRTVYRGALSHWKPTAYSFVAIPTCVCALFINRIDRSAWANTKWPTKGFVLEQPPVV